MNNRQVYTIVAGVIVLALLFCASVFEIKKVPDYKWTTNYDYESKEPFGGWLFKNLLEEKYGDDNIIIKVDTSLLDSTYNNSAYVTLGQDGSMNQEDALAIKKYVEAGNTALFINDFNPTFAILNAIADTVENETNIIDYEDDTEEDYYDDSKEESENLDSLDDLSSLFQDNTDSLLCLGFNEYDSTFYSLCYKHYIYDFEKSKPLYINKITQNDEFEFTPLATDKDSAAIFYRVNLGEGHIYIHSVPELFSNVASRQEFYLDHFNKAFSYIQADSIILGDINYKRSYNDLMRSSPLEFVLQTPSLSWAYYLLAGSMLLFAIFRSKRRQRVIPTIAPNKNTSLEYIQTLSAIYQSQNQNNKLVKHLKDGFHHRIKSKYFLDPADNEYITKLSKKSKVDSDVISRLISKLDQSARSDISDYQLINLYNQIESFYKKSK